VNILIDIVHPAHVHFFKYAISEWQARGHRLLVVAREKENNIQLLEAYGIDYIKISDYTPGIWGLLKELISRDIKLYKLIRRFKPRIMVGIAGFSIAFLGWLTRIPAIIFTDTEHARLSNFISFPFASLICTPDCYRKEAGKKQLRYKGFQELAYLHPRWFKPDKSVIERLGLAEGERFFVVRFVLWGAAHDIRERGVDQEDRPGFISRLAEYGRVLISSEAELPPELEQYRLKLPPEQIHHLLYFATLYVGESPTMASEAAILGTPAVLISSWAASAGYIMEHQRYGLVQPFTSHKAALEQAIQLASEPEIKRKWRQKSRRMLKEKIEVTPWLVKLVEEYPRRGEFPRLDRQKHAG
jgi:hypothetical protein